MDELESPLVVKEKAAGSRRRVSPWVCGAMVLVLTASLGMALLQRRETGRLLELRTPASLLLIGLHLLALGLTLSALWARERHWIDAGCLARRFAFWFWLGAGLAVTAAVFAVWSVTGDAEFLRIGAALVSIGCGAWWVVFYCARRLIRLLTNTALACCAALAATAVVELGLALLPFGSRSFETLRDQKIGFYRYELSMRMARQWHESILIADPELGYRHRPHATVKVVDAPGAPAREIQSDAWGFFNQDYDSSRPYDVAVVGDSFVAQAWCLALQDRTGLRVACFGTPGYGPPQYTVLTRRYALPAKPRAVLYCIYLNDAADAAIYADWKKSGEDWFTFRGNSWFGVPSASSGWLCVQTWLLRVSRLYAWLDLSMVPPGEDAVPVATLPLRYKTDKYTLEFDRASFGYFADVNNPRIRSGLELIRGCVAEADRLCRAAGVKLIVLLLPSKELVHYDALKSCAATGDPVENLLKFHAALEKICGELRVPCYDLKQPFQTAAATEGKALFGSSVDIHWDSDGQAVMAAIAADLLVKSGLFEDKLKRPGAP